jgi:hypothetical protein
MATLSHDLLDSEGPLFFLASYALIVLLFGGLGLLFRPYNTTQPAVLGLATGSWPRECPECIAQRVYYDFWPTPFVIANNEEQYVGIMNSTRLFKSDGSDLNSWPPSILQGLNPYHVYQLPADRDGDGRDELLSFYYPPVAGLATFRWFRPGDPVPLLERTFARGNYYLISFTVADLNGDGKSEIVLAQVDEGGPNSKISVLDSNFNILWERVLPQCSITHYGRFYDLLTVGDIDGDGGKEIFYSCEGDVNEALFKGKIYAFARDGSSFVETDPDDPYLFASLPDGPPVVALGDLDADGRKEVIANIATYSGHLVILDGNAQILAEKIFADAQREHAGNRVVPSSITLADIDNSPGLEIIVGDLRIHTDDSREASIPMPRETSLTSVGLTKTMDSFGKAPARWQAWT